MNTIKSIICTVLLIIQSISAQNFWQQTNGPYSIEDIYLYDIVAYKNDQLLAGIRNKGMFLSTDNGDHWSAINNGLPLYSSPRSIAVNANYIYTSISGVYRSSDNGTNWTQINNGLTNLNIVSLATNQPGDIFAGTIGGGVFRSTNNGDSWTPINNGLPYLPPLIIETIFVHWNGYIFLGTNLGIFKSTNNGNNWIHYPLGNRIFVDLAFISIGYIIAVATHAGITEIFISTDDGNSWTETWQANVGFTDIDVNYSNDFIYAGAYTPYGVYVSTDWGYNWNSISSIIFNTEIRTIEINTQEDIFVGTWGEGIFRSTDGGNIWEEINRGYSYPQVLNLNITSNDYIFTGTNEGIFRTTDNGYSWADMNNGLISLNIKSLANNSSDHLFAGPSGYGVWKSNNYGSGWSYLGLGGETVQAIAFDSSNHIFIGTSESGIFKSTNNGYNWAQINNGLTTNYVKCLAINSNQIIFAGTYVGIFKSRTNGAGWEHVNLGLTFLNISCLAFNNSDHIFAGTLGGGIFRSTDDGENWEAINNGINGTQIASIKCNSIGNLFLSTIGNGVFKSINNGDTWFEINEGLSDLVVYSLSLNSEEYLFAGTLAKGAFKSIDSTITELENEKITPLTFSLSQNYPNPFNPSTVISYQLPVSGMVTLRVYDILGNEIATLVNEEKQPGTYEVEFSIYSNEGRNLSSGIYFYQLKVGGPETSSLNGQAGQGFIETKKMILIK